MRRLAVITMCTAGLMLLIAGCTPLFDAIPKDTVMIKKMPQEQPGDTIDYEGVLSQEAAKTISLNAVNRYFHQTFAKEDIQFELLAVDELKLKQFFLRTSGVVLHPLPEAAPPMVLEDPDKLLEQIKDGLYYMTLKHEGEETEEVYDLVLNAKDGDILKLVQAGRKKYARTQPRDMKVLEVANQFVQEMDDYPLDELVRDEKMVRWDSIVEVYYTKQDRKSLKYSVLVDYETKKVIGFNKDVMTILSYYAME
ncbi:hypothetical protein [Paenibacillus sp. GCM10027626]|uniref:hypothetical protein n=1 Tax=Paenibacillus sp. GCM10027626 TaxID=3273411 RepID=UPI003624B80B